MSDYVYTVLVRFHHSWCLVLCLEVEGDSKADVTAELDYRYGDRWDHERTEIVRRQDWASAPGFGASESC